MSKNLLEQFSNANFVITTSAWFYGPDGKQYRGVWGKVTVHSDKETLGITTNRNSSNWYIVVGDGEKSIIIGGCQIHYAVVCHTTPDTTVKIMEDRWHEVDKKYIQVERESHIYLAQ